MAHLIVLKGHNNSKQNIVLDKDRTLLGRNANCDIVLPANDFAVSREHACILRVQGKFFIEDMGSRNGTFVNNQPVTERRPLNENDRIRICDFLYGFHEAAPVSRPPLPADMRPEQTLDEPEAVSSYEASVSTSQQFLQSQPKEKLRILVEISNSLRKTLDLDRLLPKIADNLFELFRQADRVFLLIREEAAESTKQPDRLIPKVIKTRRMHDESSASYSRSIVRECLKTVQALLCDDASTDKRFNMSASIADIRIRSVMCAPLWSQDNQALGIIQLDTQDRGKKFTQEDLNLLMAVASQASIALENARLHEDQVAAATAAERLRRDLELAQQVQLSFLPQQLPQVEGYEFYAYYEPAQEVGGDYYGFVPLNVNAELPGQRRLAIMLGDVAGKGVPAALLMAKLSADARFCLISQANPAAAITALNDLLYQNTSQMDRFVTLSAAVLDATAQTLTLVNAGHPAPLIYRRKTGDIEEATTDDTIGLPLGVAEGHIYRAHQVELQPGDCVLLYSDGVTDQLDKQNNPIRDKAIRTAFAEGIESPQMLGERIVKLLKQHASGRAQQDDITLVCFGRTG
jgi:serine phosphatase RsbU (regulator of sigma subunit)/pSer/pThr/pTyr-binding forkhead associated (FHA) protein